MTRNRVLARHDLGHFLFRQPLTADTVIATNYFALSDASTSPVFVESLRMATQLDDVEISSHRNEQKGGRPLPPITVCTAIGHSTAHIRPTAPAG